MYRSLVVTPFPNYRTNTNFRDAFPSESFYRSVDGFHGYLEVLNKGRDAGAGPVVDAYPSGVGVEPSNVLVNRFSVSVDGAHGDGLLYRQSSFLPCFPSCAFSQCGFSVSGDDT
jgi:hypothetical protein